MLGVEKHGIMWNVEDGWNIEVGIGMSKMIL